MKFLLFNVVVAASLGYLLLGEDRNATITSIAPVAPIISKIEALTATAVETTMSAVSPSEPAPIAKVEVAKTLAKPAEAAPEKPAMPARRAPAPINQEVAVAPAPPPAIPAAIPAAIPTGRAAKVASADPAAAQRRAEVLGDTPSVAGQAETPQFMTSAERRRELAQLAEDMELRFLEKVRN